MLSPWISKPMCSTTLFYFLPGYLVISRDPKMQVGYSSADISKLNDLVADFAVLTLKLLPSELFNCKNYNLSSPLRVPVTDRIKLDPRQTNSSSLYCFSLWSLSFLTCSPPRLFPEYVH